MKLFAHTYHRLLWITASASLLGIAACSNVPGTSGSNATTYSERLARDIASSPTAYDALYVPHGGGGAGSNAGGNAGGH